jgi:hypothetical protein
MHALMQAQAHAEGARKCARDKHGQQDGEDFRVLPGCAVGGNHLLLCLCLLFLVTREVCQNRFAVLFLIGPKHRTRLVFAFKHHDRIRLLGGKCWV